MTSRASDTDTEARSQISVEHAEDEGESPDLDAARSDDPPEGAVQVEAQELVEKLGQKVKKKPSDDHEQSGTPLNAPCLSSFSSFRFHVYQTQCA